MRAIGLLTFVLAGLVSTVVSAQGPPACRSEEIRRPDGWVVPGVKNPSARMPVPAGAPAFRVDKLVPRPRKVWIEVFACSDGRLEIRREKVAVSQLARRSVGGRPFAYYVVLDVLDPRTDRPLGFSYADYYYDPDGAGVFSVFVDVATIPKEYFVPGWAKRLAEGRQ